MKVTEIEVHRITLPYVDATTGKLVITAAAPIIDNNCFCQFRSCKTRGPRPSRLRCYSGFNPASSEGLSQSGWLSSTNTSPPPWVRNRTWIHRGTNSLFRSSSTIASKWQQLVGDR